MSEFKGTKGKWIVNKNLYFNEVITGKVVGGKSMRISVFIHDTTNGTPCVDLSLTEEADANALLISKSPILLEQLQKLVDMFDGRGETGSLAQTLIDNTKQLINSATN